MLSDQLVTVTHASVICCESRDPVTKEDMIGWFSDLYDSTRKLAGII